MFVAISVFGLYPVGVDFSLSTNSIFICSSSHLFVSIMLLLVGFRAETLVDSVAICVILEAGTELDFKPSCSHLVIVLFFILERLEK